MEVTVREESQQERTVSVQVEASRVVRWQAAAKRVNLTLEDWLVLSIELADHLSLVEGATRLPANGTQMDPILAAAIRRAAEGQPWEHKAIQLIGATGFRTNPKSPLPSAPRAKVRRLLFNKTTVDLFARHGVAISDARFRGGHLGDQKATWGELAVLLLLWEKAGDGWVRLARKDYAEQTGMTIANIQVTMPGMERRGWLIRDRKGVSGFIPSWRVTSRAAEHLRTGAYGLD